MFFLFFNITKCYTAYQKDKKKLTLIRAREKFFLYFEVVSQAHIKHGRTKHELTIVMNSLEERRQEKGKEKERCI